MQNIILYWMRWTWKSSIWRELAEKLNYNFIDLDVFISEKNNLNLSEFIENVGWEKFREEEYNCLKEILKGKQNIIPHPSGAPFNTKESKSINIWISSWASAPDKLVKEVIEYLKSIWDTQIEIIKTVEEKMVFPSNLELK